jgi:DNA invertase Pin-like site-specific DNA recombinase
MVAKGRQARGTKMAPEKITEIKELLAGSMFQSEIAKKTGVAQSTVSRVSRGVVK